jgi:hypothetical protein
MRSVMLGTDARTEDALMTDVGELLFLAGLAFLLAHELDAIDRGEWRFFFGFTPLSDVAAYRLFTALHVPLLVWMLANLNAPAFRVGFDLFLIVHAALHWLLRDHHHLQFNNSFSRLWIYGGALIGALHLMAF